MKVEMINDKEQALRVILETAEWCRQKGIPLGDSWQDEERIASALDAEEGDFFVFKKDGAISGACILQDWDSCREWRKYRDGNRHYYITKFCVANGFHGTGASGEMLNAIKEKAVKDGVKSVRLTAEEGLAPLYINNGFFPHWTFIGGKTGKIFVRMAWYRWTPDEFETVWRDAGRYSIRRIIYRFLKRIF